ncbi:MFS transporter [Staphylococcus delphini]|uniref:MFS transporter n=1 Tax=Staphylococcus delphini TaxID=53344 RepID=UPI000BBCD5C6|nr:MFS transporter [Staphylococcus delphini]PCF82949.1 MFS transporter [Staphylococcus delphini]
MTFFKTLKQYPSAQKFLWFSIFFFFSMYLSKTVHALWFEENHALTSFGFSYTMMAIAGSLSFFTGKIGDKISPSFALKLGAIVYAIGLVLRVFTQSFLLSGFSGFVAGLGASLVIISLRFWILTIGTKEDRPAIVSINETGTSIGVAVGTVAAGLLVTLFAHIVEHPMIYVLILAAVCCASTTLLVPKFPKKTSDEVEKEAKEQQEKPIKQYKVLVVGVVLFGVIIGLAVSLISPFMPIILKNQGLPVSLIGIFIAVNSIVSIVASPLFASQKVNRYKHWIFFGGEVIAALLLLLYLTPLSSFVILLILVVRSFLYTGSFIAQELMELEMFPQQHLGFFFGLSQSSFFIGDAVGGTFGGYIYSLSITMGILMCTALLLFNAVLFPIFYVMMSKYGKRKI